MLNLEICVLAPTRDLYQRYRKEHTVMFHPWSVLREATKPRGSPTGVHNLPTDWLVYEELHKAGRLSLVNTCTVVSPITVAIFAGPSRLPLDALEDSDSQ